jgi:hypothetical protein
VGAGQVVLGSDYPFVMGEPEPVAALGALPQPDRDRILEGNVSALLAGVRR